MKVYDYFNTEGTLFSDLAPGYKARHFDWGIIIKIDDETAVRLSKDEKKIIHVLTIEPNERLLLQSPPDNFVPIYKIKTLLLEKYFNGKRISGGTKNV